MTEHFIRHGDNLTIMTVIRDPAYLTEPMIRTRDYVYEIGGQIAPYPCESVEEVIRPKGKIPHHLPGTNTFLGEFPGCPRHPTRSRARWRGGSLPRIPGKTPQDDAGGKTGEEGGRKMKSQILPVLLFAPPAWPPRKPQRF